ncbi:ROK family protein [Gracilibacillus sp. S3-1-1]|uniref:ROK family protein n=1 Tax=Gracilibacillus pellucidus TaxID=3095368 RepID=A0ACC6M0Z6_9BACI|nr:ROK family protein [Gracilibacillus sp. S3-1-1]MDX8044566.1 ROK family protein [Gracilibacillus sp. S3-1-1]
MVYLCFDIGGTNIKYGVLQADGTFLIRDQFPTRRDHAAAFISDLQHKVIEIGEEYLIRKVGISFPGFIDSTTGYAEFAGAIDVLHGKNIIDLLAKKVTVPIVIENDANCATLAEKLIGNATNCQNFICMTIGTGIGGGIVVNDKLVTGHTCKAGEFGLMIVDGMKTGYKTMHELASTSALIDQYKQFKGLGKDDVVEGAEVFHAARKEQPVQDILDQWFQYVSYGIFNIAATLNPEKILIGGAISIRDDLYTKLADALSMIPSWRDIEVEIEPCQHHNDAGMLGALYKCLEEETV